MRHTPPLGPQALETDARSRAVALGLRIFRVVFEKTVAGVPTGAKTVAVRSGPSRSASIVAVRRKGDEVLVCEERAGW
eukprot:7369133-Prymnesium_polylepis.1